MLQQGLKNALELTFQLDEIDYQAGNFVHADMTPQEFEQSMAERGESLLSIMWGMMMSAACSSRAEQAAEGAKPGRVRPRQGVPQRRGPAHHAHGVRPAARADRG
jgi:hypothetical protein